MKALRTAAGAQRDIDHGLGDRLWDKDLGAAVDAFHFLPLLRAEAHDVAVGGRVVEVEVTEAVAEAGHDLGRADGDEVEEVGVRSAVVGDGGDGIERVEGLGPLCDGAEVDEGEEQGAVGGDEVRNDGGFSVKLADALVFGEGVRDGVELASVPLAEAAPDGAHLVSFCSYMRGDTEVVLAGFHGPPEIAIGICVGVDERAIGQDHLKIDDVVAGESFVVGVVGEASTSN